jgi:hypothetical protein
LEVAWQVHGYGHEQQAGGRSGHDIGAYISGQ